MPLLDLAEGGEDLALRLAKFFVGNLAEFETHLGFEQSLSKGGVVLHLRIYRCGHLVQDESQRPDQEAIEDEQFSRSFQLEPDVDEVVRRPWPCVFERQLVELARDRLHFRIEGLFLIAGNQERRVHDHLVPDGLVDP